MDVIYQSIRRHSVTYDVMIDQHKVQIKKSLNWFMMVAENKLKKVTTAWKMKLIPLLFAIAVAERVKFLNEFSEEMLSYEEDLAITIKPYTIMTGIKLDTEIQQRVVNYQNRFEIRKRIEKRLLKIRDKLLRSLLRTSDYYINWKNRICTKIIGYFVLCLCSQFFYTECKKYNWSIVGLMIYGLLQYIVI